MDKKNLIIVASAPCIFDDLARIGDHSRFDFMAINHDSPALLHIERIEHLASYEDVFEIAKKLRKDAGLNTDYATYSNQPHPGVDHVLPDLMPPTCSFDCKSRLSLDDARALHNYSGTSTMLGLKVGLRFGYKKIIIAGAPLTDSGYPNYHRGWTWVADFLRCCPVRSVSGFTRDLLGEYTEDWLNE